MSRDDRKRAIGKVVSVAADRFVIEMHTGTDNFTIVGFDDVHYVARLGSFLLIPVHSEYVVVEVVGLREKDIGNSLTGAGELDKVASAKYLDVVPVGMLPADRASAFRFGVSIFPSLYADALYALDAELDRVFETNQASRCASGDLEGATRLRSLSIGRSVVFDGYDVKVRIDDFFGGHTAVLGNTGSGKSCTVASILQSLFNKPDEFSARGATFVVFDVNGEYASALKPLANHLDIDVMHVVLDGTASEDRFRIPHWFLEQSEWELLLQASEKTQIPVLRTALGLTGLFRDDGADALKVREHFVATCILECFQGVAGDSPVGKFQRVVSLLQKYPTKNLNMDLLSKYKANTQFGNFPDGQMSKFLAEVGCLVLKDVELPSYKRDPFTFDDLEECLDFALLYEKAHGNRQIRDYCSQMMTRFKSLRDRSEYAFMRYDVKKSEDDVPSVVSFLEKLLGLKESKGKWTKSHQITIVDMNAVEDEVVELVSSVLARMIFRQLRRAEPRNNFPVHLLLEEAHRYIAEAPTKYAIDANRIYGRIAKEGRKYGLFLLVASQRPSELSRTVLSQCSNFVIHRIQNPDDLSHIRQMTPFISDAVLKRLPSLPKQHALVFGTSVNLPTTFKVRKAEPLPKSDDAKIGCLWFYESGKPVKVRVGP